MSFSIHITTPVAPITVDIKMENEDVSNGDDNVYLEPYKYTSNHTGQAFWKQSRPSNPEELKKWEKDPESYEVTQRRTNFRIIEKIGYQKGMIAFTLAEIERFVVWRMQGDQYNVCILLILSS